MGSSYNKILDTKNLVPKNGKDTLLSKTDERRRRRYTNMWELFLE